MIPEQHLKTCLMTPGSKLKTSVKEPTTRRSVNSKPESLLKFQLLSSPTTLFAFWLKTTTKKKRKRENRLNKRNLKDRFQVKSKPKTTKIHSHIITRLRIRTKQSLFYQIMEFKSLRTIITRTSNHLFKGKTSLTNLTSSQLRQVNQLRQVQSFSHMVLQLHPRSK
jgi:hypothetical protein